MLLGEAHNRRWFLFGDFDYAKPSADGAWGLSLLSTLGKAHHIGPGGLICIKAGTTQLTYK